METSLTRQLFGPVGPGLVVPDVKLPFLYKSRKSFPLSSSIGSRDINGTDVIGSVADDRCWGFVTSSEGADYSNWYNLWEGASAVDHMCVSRAKNGEAQKIGKSEIF